MPYLVSTKVLPSSHRITEQTAYYKQIQSLNVCNYYESFKSTIEKFLKF